LIFDFTLRAKNTYATDMNCTATGDINGLIE